MKDVKARTVFVPPHRERGVVHARIAEAGVAADGAAERGVWRTVGSC
jgi:hypothetical protein